MKSKATVNASLLFLIFLSTFANAQNPSDNFLKSPSKIMSSGHDEQITSEVAFFESEQVLYKIAKNIQIPIKIETPKVKSILKVSKNIVYFTSTRKSEYYYEGTDLWVTDGTKIGTKKIIENVAEYEIRSYGYFAMVGDKLFVPVWHGRGDDAKLQLWAATPVGAEVVFDDISNFWPEVSACNNITYLRGSNFISKTDGTTSGTKLLKSFSSPGRNYWSVSSSACFNGELYFNMFNSELWKTDGTESGTVLVVDFFNTDDTPNVHSLTVLDQVLYFGVKKYPHINKHSELWKLENSTQSPQLWGDLALSNGAIGVKSFFQLDGSVFITTWLNSDSWTDSIDLWHMPDHGRNAIKLGNLDLVGNGIGERGYSKIPHDLMVVDKLAYFTSSKHSLMTIDANGSVQSACKGAEDGRLGFSIEVYDPNTKKMYIKRFSTEFFNDEAASTVLMEYDLPTKNCRKIGEFSRGWFAHGIALHEFTKVGDRLYFLDGSESDNTVFSIDVKTLKIERLQRNF